MHDNVKKPSTGVNALPNYMQQGIFDLENVCKHANVDCHKFWTINGPPGSGFWKIAHYLVNGHAVFLCIFNTGGYQLYTQDRRPSFGGATMRRRVILDCLTRCAVGDIKAQAALDAIGLEDDGINQAPPEAPDMSEPLKSSIMGWPELRTPGKTASRPAGAVVDFEPVEDAPAVVGFDPIAKARHYNMIPAKCSACEHPIECIDVIKHMNFPRGSAVKYIWRADYKADPIEDLDKAIRYLQIERERLMKMDRATPFPEPDGPTPAELDDDPPFPAVLGMIPKVIIAVRGTLTGRAELRANDPITEYSMYVLDRRSGTWAYPRIFVSLAEAVKEFEALDL